jgi:hypothetical protein
MSMQIKLGLIVLMSVLMCACASNLKAPCDEHAHFCGMKTKINQW